MLFNSISVQCLQTSRDFVMSTLCLGDSHVVRFGDFIGNTRSSSEVFNVQSLDSVHFYGIRGGSVLNSQHLDQFLSVVQQYRPAFLIVHIGGNDLDKIDDCTELMVLKLVAFLTYVRQSFQIRNITLLKFIPRMSTRYISYELYNSRVIQANQLLELHCATANIQYWKLRGFTNSRDNIYSDGVHLNRIGLEKYFREIRGILLHHRKEGV